MQLSPSPSSLSPDGPPRSAPGALASGLRTGLGAVCLLAMLAVSLSAFARAGIPVSGKADLHAPLAAAPDTTEPDSTRPAPAPDPARLNAERPTPVVPDTVDPDTVDPDTVDPDTVRPTRDRTERLMPAVPASQIEDTLSPSFFPGADTVRSDSTVLADTGRTRRYLPASPVRRGGLFERASPFLSVRDDSQPTSELTLDTLTGNYVRPGSLTRPAMRYSADTYRRERFRANRTSNWRTLAEQRQQQRRQRGGLGVNIVVPGGRQSAFSTIFGKPQVDLRVNGRADIAAGFAYNKSDRQASVTGDASQIDPDFQQDLSLGITGTIGDKMQIDVDWDTQNQFDYQNQVKLEYTGYEDEIIQSFEAGNVFLETPSQLIQGGQSLFGLKSELQFGNLRLTTVASQQEGQANTVSIEGGSETNEFDLKPTDYDEDTHYFLGYFFRNSWNDAHANPSTLTLQNGFSEITEVEVWKLRTSRASDEPNVRQAVAVVDLGESPDLVRNADGYTGQALFNTDADQYDSADITALRDGERSVSTYVTTAGNLNAPLSSQDFVDGQFKKLEAGRDYTIDKQLGYLSLSQRLRSDEALAVAFRYRANGQVRTVGDFSASQTDGTQGGLNADRLLLKLLRPTDPVAPSESIRPAAWFLELRNIYRLGGRGFNPDNFNLDIFYEPSGQTNATTIPEVAGQTQLLTVLGLDRLNQNGAPSPDDRFDFSPLTIDSKNGLLIFPYLQPFGQRLVDVGTANNARDAAEDVAFLDLYLKKRTNAETQNTEENIFRIRGEYKGATQEFYDLKAFAGLVEGSVKVTAGGQTLQEGTDYVVDYQGGTVTITNQSYLAEGREIQIDYEKNSFVNLQQKTLLGTRADWNLNDRFALGTTLMRLSEKSPVDKFRIGEEPIKNTIWGVDGSMDLEPRWLTRAVDALPLVQTKSKSTLSVSGEFAQLRPGHTNTEAYQRTLEDVQSSDADTYASDERNGVSYIDDFEGFENTFSLRQNLGAWQISAAPVFEGESDAPGVEDDLQRSYRRGAFAWYQLNDNLRERLSGKVREGNPEATETLDITDVFDRDTRGDVDPTLRPLDLYFDPHRRGPYNYTDDLQTFLQEPRKAWGGFTQRLPQGYTDFSLQNVEFVEFIVKVVPESGSVPDDAKLYVNLGSISEDVIPNETLNDEDGLTNEFREDDLDRFSRIANGTQNGAIDIRNGRTEDLGLDGLVSYTDDPYNVGVREQTVFADLINQTVNCGTVPISRAECQAELARYQNDPSGDDYHFFENDVYFNNTSLFPNGTTLQERFLRYYAGHELNGFETQNELAVNVSTPRGLARTPDTEDLDGTGGTVDILNDYYEYAVPLSRARLDELGTPQETEDYVVSPVGTDEGWYKIRIPVRDFTRKVGTIDGFTRIRAIRMWTQGHDGPVTMRLASLELVGSQWRTSDPVADEPAEQPDSPVMDRGRGTLRVASINDEEDQTYKAPIGAIVSRNRTSRGAQQLSREQALLLNADTLEVDQQRGVFKTFAQQLNLLKYSNLRMYVHAHGGAGMPGRREEVEQNARLFVRLGSNETSDYYEYEQPLTFGNVPTASTPVSALWPEENEMNIELSALNQLKVARDQSTVPIDSVFALDAGDFTRDGTTLRIKGTPSLQSISTVIIGVRHTGATDRTLYNTELWVNELRVSGYDERPGWAALANANVDLADLGSVQASFRQSTDGFGPLSSTLAERQQSDRQEWTVRSDVNLDKLLPESQGWSIPVTLQVQSRTQTPRFDPVRGDVRVEEVVGQVESLPDSTLRSTDGGFANRYPGASPGEKRQLLADSVRAAAQTTSFQRSLTANVSKQRSDAWVLRQTVDATSLGFTYSDRTARTPRQQTDDQWNWSADAQYRLNFGRPRTVSPFWFVDGVPVLGLLGDLDFNYVPQSVSFSASAQRDVSTSRDRSTALRPGEQTVPGRVANPLRERQSFDHRRSFSLQYNPFNFLNLSFDTRTQQNLNDVGALQDTTITVLDSTRSIVQAEFRVRDVGDLIQEVNRLIRIGQIDATDTNGDGQVDIRDLAPDRIFQDEDLQFRSEGAVFRRLFFGSASPRTNQYQQRFSATIRPSFTDGEALNWIDLQDVVYRSQFQWQNGAQGSLTGANVSNNLNLTTGVNLHPNKVWERFGFYQSLKDGLESSGSQGGSRRGRARPGDRGNDPEADEADASGEDESSEDEPEEDDNGPSLSDLPLPNVGNVLRRAALTVLDIRDFSISYTGDRSARSTNVGNLAADTSGVGVDYSLLDALSGQGPSLGYRFGLDRSIDAQQRVLLDRLQVNDALQNTNRLDARTSLTPSRALSVDLSWEVQWSKQQNVTFQTFPPDAPDLPDDVLETESGRPFQRFTDESGDNRASVWAFGSYESVVASQIERLQSTLATTPDGPFDADQVALTNATVSEDFRTGLLTGGGSVGGRGLIPFPMPGWTVRYTGFSSWPLVRSVAQNATLSHNYNATYSSGFTSLSTAGEETTLNIGPAGTFTYLQPNTEVQAVQVSERFNPLVGVSVTWLGDLSTSLDYNRNVNTFLRAASLRVEEKKASEVSLRLDYRRRGIKIPLLPLGRIQNEVAFSLTLSRQVTDEREFNLRRALEEAQANDFNYDPAQGLQGDNVSINTQTTLLTVRPQLTYTVSDRVSANFTLQYERFDGDSRQPSYTNIEGGFNVTVNISEN